MTINSNDQNFYFASNPLLDLCRVHNSNFIQGWHWLKIFNFLTRSFITQIPSAIDIPIEIGLINYSRYKLTHSLSSNDQLKSLGKGKDRVAPKLTNNSEYLSCISFSISQIPSFTRLCFRWTFTNLNSLILNFRTS